MDTTILAKGFATVLLSIGATYMGDHNAVIMAYVAGGCIALGSFLMGLYTLAPTQEKKNG